MKRLIVALLVAVVGLALAGPASAAIGVSVVDVSGDQTSQNETPLAVNPANSANMITGDNDWNYNDGCGVNTTLDGGLTWTPTLPNGFLPGVTEFTNDPAVPGTGAYDAGGDPTIAFGPGGKTAYYVCQAFDFTSPYPIALLLNRSHDGGLTWQQTGLTQVSTWNGNGKSKGSQGQFPDHENLHVDTSPSSPYQGTVYVTWAQFNGQGTHSPVNVAVSHDGGASFTVAQVTAGKVRNNQDQRIVTAPNGDAYLTFDNGVQGGKGTVLYVSKSTDGGATWSTPVQFAALTDPVCIFPGYCFNISGTPFRAGGTYPAPAFDPVRNRLDVVYADIKSGFGQVYFQSAPAKDLHDWTSPVAVAPASADQFEGELSVAPNGRIDTSFYDRSYSANRLVDVTYATSADGGATWQKARVSTAGFDPGAWGVPSGDSFRPFIGDYNGMISTNAFAGITWTGVAPPQPFNLEVDFAKVTP
ncbi:MAG TPA: sialidase family protein [Gaiellaceae bacterium]|nr:sialidase family protein [Gaiellaceae bacterium]